MDHFRFLWFLFRTVVEMRGRSLISGLIILFREGNQLLTPASKVRGCAVGCVADVKQPTPLDVHNRYGQ